MIEKAIHIPILVNSCDAYSDIREVFFAQLRKTLLNMGLTFY